MKPVQVLAHLATMLALLVLTPLFLLVCSDSWYRPTEPQGVPDGGAIATLEAWFVAMPIVVVVYLVAVVVTSGPQGEGRCEWGTRHRRLCLLTVTAASRSSGNLTGLMRLRALTTAEPHTYEVRTYGCQMNAHLTWPAALT